MGAERTDGHLPALDGVRGIAVSLVVALHFIPIAGFVTLGPPGRFVEALANLGGIGVDVFFVLSGFLITGILLKTCGKPHYFSFFYARRSLRIFPLYYVALAVTFLVLPLVVPPEPSYAADHQGWMWLYGTNFLSAYYGKTLAANGVTLNHFWSLAVEEQFYLVWPALIFVCRRPRHVAIVAIAMLVVAFGARAIEIRHHGIRAINMLTWCRFDALAFGALLSIAYSRAEMWPRFRRLAVLAGSVAALLYVAIGVATFYGVLPNRPIVVLAMFPLQLLVGGAFVSYALDFGPHRFLTSRPLVWLGQRSYGVYVYHGMIRIALAYVATQLVGKFGEPLAAVPTLLIGLVAALLISELSYRLLESPINALKRYFVIRPGSSST